jgi:hypothetical protein
MCPNNRCYCRTQNFLGTKHPLWWAFCSSANLRCTAAVATSIPPKRELRCLRLPWARAMPPLPPLPRLSTSYTVSTSLECTPRSRRHYQIQISTEVSTTMTAPLEGFSDTLLVFFCFYVIWIGIIIICGSEKRHYNSSILRFTITILLVLEICHFIRLSWTWTQLQG